jgi:GNAT superfamily N-acetyltransferase
MEKLVIRPAVAIREVAAVRNLWREYWTEFGFTPCFQGFEEEVESLPGKYRLLLAFWHGEPAGTVAWYPFDEQRAEFKRLFVRNRFRGKGIAKSLLEEVVGEVRAAGYRSLLCDTIPGSMATALEMYRALGFVEIPSYLTVETPGAVALQLNL